MPEQLLDRAQVGAALEQVRGEGVPQPVRVGEEAAQRARVQPPAARGEEERVVRAARQLRPRLAQVAGDDVRRLLAERHDPLLAALAAHADELLLEVDVGEIEPDRLGAAQAGRVDELDECAVAEAERAVAVRPSRSAPRPAPASAPPAAAAAVFGASDASGTRVGPSVKRRNERTAASLRAIVAGASPLRARPSSDA